MCRWFDVNNKSKKAEIKIIREFLNFRGCKVLRIIPNERPDAIVVIEEAGKRKKVGIEHTEYHVDAPPGKPSSGRKVHSFWHHVRSSIRRRVSHRPILKHITGLVSLKEDNHPRQSRARDLAEELVKLALEHINAIPNGEHRINNFSNKKYPLLSRYVKKVILYGTGSACNVSWGCVNANVSAIGVSAKEITLIIQNKTKEFPKYCWGNVKERWLLISASGKTVFNLATSHPERVEWEANTLQSACLSSNVDRIFFWDRTFNWYKEVWPGAPIVQREWRPEKIYKHETNYERE
jgi:hypothetical protein